MRLDYWNPKHWNWYSFSSEMKMRTSYIYPTLNHFTRGRHQNTNYLLPPHCPVHLATLNLHSVSPNDSGNENSNSLTQAASKGSCTNGFSHSDWPVRVAFEEERRVWYEILSICLFLINSGYRFHRVDILAIRVLSVYFFFEDYVHLGSGTMYDCLTSPAILEHLELNIFVSSWQH